MNKAPSKVCLAGNPNTGKSSLFNALTGLNQKVGNFPGVTVEKKSGTFYHHHQTFQIVDIPGTYSLFPRSTDEQIAIGEITHPKHPAELIVVVLDAANLKRNLLFYTQLCDLNIPMIAALNMVDNAHNRGIKIDLLKLEEQLGIPVVPINARSEKGIQELKNEIVKGGRIPTSCNIDLFSFPEPALLKVRNKFPELTILQANNLLLHADQIPHISNQTKTFIEEIHRAEGLNIKELQARETIARYQSINEWLAEVVQENIDAQAESYSNKLDRVLTHQIIGPLLFLGILFIVFQSIFTLAQVPMDAIDSGFAQLRMYLKNTLPTSFITNLFCDGILGGLSGIFVFIPQIAILFLFIGVLEDTGYLARVSFMLDRLMKKFGLNGKSIVPLMGGVACAVPAIMSTRTIENKKDRLITILVTPLVSCSARLPVFTLLISMVVPSERVAGIFNLQGLTLMLFYLLGIVAAIGSAIVLKWIIATKEPNYFLMELPVYRIPRWKNLGIEVYNKVKSFVVDAGKVILVIAIALWFLASYSPTHSKLSIEKKYEQISTSSEKNKLVQAELLEYSYAGYLGKMIEPAIAPMGFDWKIGIALITSFSAREVFVGTMATIFSVEDDEANNKQLKQKMMEAVNPATGEKIFTFATSFSLMIFFALAMQCMSTLGVVKRETNSWKWPMVQLFFMTFLAYFCSFVTYQILS